MRYYSALEAISYSCCEAIELNAILICFMGYLWREGVIGGSFVVVLTFLHNYDENQIFMSACRIDFR